MRDIPHPTYHRAGPLRRSSPIQQAIRAWLVGISLACTVVPSGYVLAQSADATRAFAIPAGSLAQSLNRFASESDINLSFSPELVEGKQARTLQGRYTITEGLETLLNSSGLIAVPAGSGFRLEQSPRQSGVLELEPTMVTGTLVGTRVGETAAESSASVKVFGATDLDERPGTDEVQDLYDRTPNVTTFGDGVFAPAIRGVDATGAASGGLGFIAGTRPRMTLTVDGRPLSTFELVGGPTGLWDVEQVELYRGPQTTLQGRNSIAGAMIVETKDPTFHWEGAARTAIGTHDRQRLSAMLSGPLSDSFAMRLSADRLDAEGFADYLGPQGVRDSKESDSQAVRGKLLFAPVGAPDFTAQLTLANTKTRRPQSQFVDLPYDGRKRVASQTAFETDVTDTILEVDYRIDDLWSFSNISTYSEITFDRLDAPARGQFKLDGPQFTNEARFNYDNEASDVQAVLGAYVFHENRDDSLYAGTPLSAEFDDRTLTTSAYGEITWPVAPRLRLTAGARYEREERQREGTAFGIDTDLDETFDAFLPKFGAAYEASDDLLIGAVVSRGFNAGGGSVSFGASDAAGNTSTDPALGARAFIYEPEYVWNYEIYARATALQERLVFSGNLFFSDFEDQQRVEQLDFPGGFTDTIIVNTPKSHAYGAELGVNYQPQDELELFADVGLLKTKIDKSSQPSLEGNEFARAPRFSASLGAVYRPTRTWMFSVDGIYMSSYHSSEINNPLTRVDAHFIANAKVTWQAMEHLRLSTAVTNLFDSDAERQLFSFPATAAPDLAQVVEPRVVWLQAETSF